MHDVSTHLHDRGLMHKFIYENVRYVLDRRKYTFWCGFIHCCFWKKKFLKIWQTLFQIKNICRSQDCFFYLLTWEIIFSLNHFQQFENYVSKVQTVNIRQYLEHPHMFVKTNQKHIYCGDHIPSTHTCISLAP